MRGAGTGSRVGARFFAAPAGTAGTNTRFAPGGGVAPAGSRRAPSGGTPMNDGREIVKLLPALRRYARALSGSQESGDAWVRLFLEAYLTDRALIGDGPSLRVELYRGRSE